MAQSKRVFLTIMGDDDFWGNGDGMDDEKMGKKGKKRQQFRNLEIVENSEVHEKEDFMYDGDLEDGERFLEPEGVGYFSNRKLIHDDEEFHSCEEEIPDDFYQQHAKFESILMSTKMRRNSGSTCSGKDNESVKTEKTFSDDQQSDQKDSGVGSIESNDDTYHVGFRTFLQNRPESEVRAFYEGPFDCLNEQFYEAYDQIRRELETSPHWEVVQQLRRISPMMNSQRFRSKHAVVVSSFREPDRRLGRYSKYYYHHNVGPEVYSRKVFVGGLPACISEVDIIMFFNRFGRLQVDWPSKHYSYKSDSDPSIGSNDVVTTVSHPVSHLAQLNPPFGQINPFLTDFSSPPPIVETVPNREKKQQHPGYVFLLFEKERSVRDLVAECFEEEEGLFITMDNLPGAEGVRVQIRPWLLADAEFLMDFNVPINTKLVAFIGGVPRPLKAVELAHFFEQTYGHVVCVGIDIDNKFKYPRGSGRVAFSNYEAYVQAITDRYIVLDHEDIHKRVEIKPYFFHNQSCEECSGRYHRQHAPFFCPSLECFQYYCEACWHKMHAHPSRLHHMPVIKGV